MSGLAIDAYSRAPVLDDYDFVNIDCVRAWLAARGWSVDAAALAGQSDDATAQVGQRMTERWSRSGGAYALLPLRGFEVSCRWGMALDDVCSAEGIAGRERWAVLDAWMGVVGGE